MQALRVHPREYLLSFINHGSIWIYSLRATTSKNELRIQYQGFHRGWRACRTFVQGYISRSLTSVARAPPDRMRSQPLSMSINLLTAEVQDKDTVLSRSSKDRVEIANSVLKDTTKTLLDLEHFSKSFNPARRKSGLSGRSNRPGIRPSLRQDCPKLTPFEHGFSIRMGRSNLLPVFAEK